MGDAFDPYREALVLETAVEWPLELEPADPAERDRLETALQARPREAAELEYVRLHTGFCRTIKVTPADLERLQAAAGGRQE